MSGTGRDLAKGTVVTLIPTGLGFLLSGPEAGIVCLFVAGAISVILWTPFGEWLGFHSDSEPVQSLLRPDKLARSTKEPNGALTPGARHYGAGAIQQAIFERARHEERTSVEAEFVAMIEEGEALKGNAFGGEEPTSDEFFAWREPIAQFIGDVLGATERQRLLEVEPTTPDIAGNVEGIIGWLRQRRDNPDAWELQIDGDELEAAIKQRRQGSSANGGTLADQLDAFMREGIDLVGDFSEPVQPEKNNGVWKVSGGDAPKEWWDQAAAFQRRIRDLLQAEHSALLTDFRDGCNRHLQREREAQEKRKQDPSADRRSNADKVLDLANYERSGPRREVEAFLEGLAAARHRLAMSQA